MDCEWIYLAIFFWFNMILNVNLEFIIRSSFSFFKTEVSNFIFAKQKTDNFPRKCKNVQIMVNAFAWLKCSKKKCSHNVQRPIDIADNSAKRISHCYLRVILFVVVVQWNANFSNLQGKWKFVIVHKRQRQSQAVFPFSRAILTRHLQQLKSTVP